MVSIESEADFDSYRSVFGELWKSASLRLSLVEGDGHWIPNGEVIFHRDAHEPEQTDLYSIDDFVIYEETFAEPFDLVEQLYQNELTVKDWPIEASLEHRDGNTSNYFQTGISESRVFDDRPRSELNTVFTVDIPDEAYYNEMRDAVDERIKTADEPYFDLNKAEFYYFDYHFRGKSSADPMVLVFADPAIQFDVDDENRLDLQFPIELADDTTVIAYPQRPYGEHMGWKRAIGEQEVEVGPDGLATYTEQLDLGEIQEVYFSVYVADKLMQYERHYNPEVEVENDRFHIFAKYDQRGDLPKYLTGKDPNEFEIGVLNMLSLAGYIVQWFGEDSFTIPNYSPETSEPAYDEIDIIAHAPDGSHIAFVECTNQRISEKTSLLDRMEHITSVIQDSENTQFGSDPQWGTRTVPCIATPQSPAELNDQVVENLESMGIVVLDGEKLVDICRASAKQADVVRVDGDPGFWLRQPK